MLFTEVASAEEAIRQSKTASPCCKDRWCCIAIITIALTLPSLALLLGSAPAAAPADWPLKSQLG